MIISALLLILVLTEYLGNVGLIQLDVALAIKLALTLFALLFSFFRGKPRAIYMYLGLMLLLTLKTFLHPGTNWSLQIQESFKLLVYPIWLSLATTERANSDSMLFVLALLSGLIMIGVLPAGGIAYDLSIYESVGAGYVGIFQNAHAAGLSYVAAFGFSLYHFQMRKTKRHLFLTLLFGFFAFSSFVRTAWLPLLVIGLVPFVQAARKDVRKALLVIAVICVAALWVLDNELVLDRLLNRNKFSDAQGFENLGSNRIMLWLTNIGIITDTSWTQVLWGFGREGAFENMNNAIGLSKVSHNLILDVLVREGVMGLILFLWAVKELVTMLWRSANRFGGVSCIAIIFSWMFFQGTNFFFFDVVLAMFTGHIIQSK